MKRTVLALCVILALLMGLTACGGEETTLTGMVVSVEGTVLTLVEMDEDMDFSGFSGGEMPQGGMGGFGGFSGEMPEGFSGEMPE